MYLGIALWGSAYELVRVHRSLSGRWTARQDTTGSSRVEDVSGQRRNLGRRPDPEPWRYALQ